MSRAVLTAATLLIAGCGQSNLLLQDNATVATGNERLAAKDSAGALEAYDRAARELPSEPGVHQNRGLALMAQDTPDEAQKAFEQATDRSFHYGSPDYQQPETGIAGRGLFRTLFQPLRWLTRKLFAPADDVGASTRRSEAAELRADAYYDVGLLHYARGDADATEEKHKTAKGHFERAAKAFEESLRNRPGNRDAAWNLELARRRIVDEQQRQEQQEQEQEEQQQEEEQQDQDQQDPDQQDQNQDQQGQDEQDQDPQDQDQQGQDQNEDPQNQDQQGQDQQDSDPQDPDQQGEPQDQEPTDPEEDQSQEGGQQDAEEAEEPQELPSDVARILDDLQDGEDSLQRHRARSRAARERRRVLQDW